MTFILSSNYIASQVPFWFQLPKKKKTPFKIACFISWILYYNRGKQNNNIFKAQVTFILTVVVKNRKVIIHK